MENFVKKYIKSSDTIEEYLFGVLLKPGYIIEYESPLNSLVVFPMKKGLAVAYYTGGYNPINCLDETKILSIRSMAEYKNDLMSGKVLWKRPQ